jgi:hypothetical protein
MLFLMCGCVCCVWKMCVSLSVCVCVWCVMTIQPFLDSIHLYIALE